MSDNIKNTTYSLPTLSIFETTDNLDFCKAFEKAIEEAVPACGFSDYNDGLDSASALVVVTDSKGKGAIAAVESAAKMGLPALVVVPDNMSSTVLANTHNLRALPFQDCEFSRELDLFLKFAVVDADLAEKIASAREREGAAEATINDLYYMGRGMLDGVGCERDNTRGIEMIKASTYAGLLEAKNCLAYMYQRGKSVEKNTDTALVWAEKALQQAETVFEKRNDNKSRKNYSNSLWQIIGLYIERNEIAMACEKLEVLYTLWKDKDLEICAEVSYLLSIFANTLNRDPYNSLLLAYNDGENCRNNNGSPLNDKRLANLAGSLTTLAFNKDDYKACRKFCLMFDKITGYDSLSEMRDNYVKKHMSAGDQFVKQDDYELSRTEYLHVTNVCEEMLNEDTVLNRSYLSAFFKLGFMEEQRGNQEAAYEQYMKYSMLYLGKDSITDLFNVNADNVDDADDIIDDDLAVDDELIEEEETIAKPSILRTVIVTPAENTSDPADLDDDVDFEPTSANDELNDMDDDSNTEIEESNISPESSNETNITEKDDLEDDFVEEDVNNNAEVNADNIIKEVTADGVYSREELESMAKSAGNYAIMAASLESSGNYDKAKGWCVEAVKLRREVFKATNADSARAALGMSVMSLAKINEALNENEEALRNYDMAMRLISPLAVNDAVLYDAMGQGYLGLGRCNNNADDVRSAIAVWTELAEKTHSDAYDEKLITAKMQLSDMLTVK